MRKENLKNSGGLCGFLCAFASLREKSFFESLSKLPQSIEQKLSFRAAQTENPWKFHLVVLGTNVAQHRPRVRAALQARTRTTEMCQLFTFGSSSQTADRRES
jgi:hypothetical protein